MIQQKLICKVYVCIWHKYRQSLLGNTVVRGPSVAHRPAVPPGQPDHMPTICPVSHHIPSTQHEQAFCPHSDAPTTERMTLGSQCADNTRWLAPRDNARKQQCLARARMSHPNWTYSSRRITQYCPSSKSLALAMHSGEQLLLFHGPTVAVHHSVTGIPHCRPSAPNFLQLTVFRVSKTIEELICNERFCFTEPWTKLAALKK